VLIEGCFDLEPIVRPATHSVCSPYRASRQLGSAKGHRCWSHLLFAARTGPVRTLTLADTEWSTGCRTFARAVSVLPCKQTHGHTVHYGLDSCQASCPW
jgi:hypothetical protein